MGNPPKKSIERRLMLFVYPFAFHVQYSAVTQCIYTYLVFLLYLDMYGRAFEILIYKFLATYKDDVTKHVLDCLIILS